MGVYMDVKVRFGLGRVGGDDKIRYSLNKQWLPFYPYSQRHAASRQIHVTTLACCRSRVRCSSAYHSCMKGLKMYQTNSHFNHLGKPNRRDKFTSAGDDRMKMFLKIKLANNVIDSHIPSH